MNAHGTAWLPPARTGVKTAHAFCAITLWLAVTISGFGQAPGLCAPLSATSAPTVIRGNVVSVRLHKGRVEVSTNNTAWLERPAGVSTFFRSITYGMGHFVAVGGSYLDEPGVIVTSQDGMTWVRRHLNNKINLHSVTWGQGLFVAVGDEGAILTSTNGARWKRQPSKSSAVLAAAAFGNGVFVVGGESGTILTSTNSIDWNARSVGRPIYVGTIVFSEGRFLAQSGNVVFVSTNGFDW